MILLVGSDHRPAYKRLARALREAISDGTYIPGHVAFTGSSLTDQLGLSRNTVDQALHRLAQERLMAVVHGRGWQVTAEAPQLVALMIAIDNLDQDLARAHDELAGGLTASALRAVVGDLTQSIDDVRTIAVATAAP